MRTKLSIEKVILMLVVCFASTPGTAAIQLNNTRVIINESKSSGFVTAKNSSEDPFVIQNWVEGPNGEMETPFFVTPPLNRLDGGNEFSLNIRKVNDRLPNDRESHYWLNVLEIPQADKNATNTLTLAVRTRIKIFYRPTSIGVPGDVTKALDWRLIRERGNCQISLKNNSAFIVNFSEIRVDGTKIESGRGYMSLPFSEQTTALLACPVKGEVLAQIVNDYGAFIALPAIQLN